MKQREERFIHIPPYLDCREQRFRPNLNCTMQDLDNMLMANWPAPKVKKKCTQKD